MLVSAAAVSACAFSAATPLSGGSAPSADAAQPQVATAAGNAKHKRLVARMEGAIADCAIKRRLKRGLKPLIVDPRLARAARFHAKNMAKGDFFDHIDPSGRTSADRIRIFAGKAFPATSENLAAGQRGFARVCRGWMTSEPHRGNILTPGYTHVGGGFALGGRYGRYYVMELGRHRR